MVAAVSEGGRCGAMYLVYPDPDATGPGAQRLGEIIRHEARAWRNSRPSARLSGMCPQLL
jgi:hypothetical protein